MRVVGSNQPNPPIYVGHYRTAPEVLVAVRAILDVDVETHRQSAHVREQQKKARQFLAMYADVRAKYLERFAEFKRDNYPDEEPDDNSLPLDLTVPSEVQVQAAAQAEVFPIPAAIAAAQAA